MQGVLLGGPTPIFVSPWLLYFFAPPDLLAGSFPLHHKLIHGAQSFGSLAAPRLMRAAVRSLTIPDLGRTVPPRPIGAIALIGIGIGRRHKSEIADSVLEKPRSNIMPTNAANEEQPFRFGCGRAVLYFSPVGLASRQVVWRAMANSIPMITRAPIHPESRDQRPAYRMECALRGQQPADRVRLGARPDLC